MTTVILCSSGEYSSYGVSGIIVMDRVVPTPEIEACDAAWMAYCTIREKRRADFIKQEHQRLGVPADPWYAQGENHRAVIGKIYQESRLIDAMPHAEFIIAHLGGGRAVGFVEMHEGY